MSLDWQGCKEKRLVKSVSPDYRLIESLYQTSKDREKTADMLPVNETTKETVISLFYDVLRELLEAIALQQGYKIYNHECYTPFLGIVIKDEEFAAEFDSIRMLRNGINYYGKKVSLTDAQAAVVRIKKMIDKNKKFQKIRATTPLILPQPIPSVG